MTLQEMQAITMRHWKAHHRKAIAGWPKGELAKQAMGAARLTQMEIQALELIGVQPEQAWSDERTLFCLTAPPDLSETPGDPAPTDPFAAIRAALTE